MIDAHAHALEAFNRATHPDALPEMQFAEELQPVEHPFRNGMSPWVYGPAIAALTFILTVIGANTL